VSEAVHRNTFDLVLDAASPLHGLIAYCGGPLGFVHFYLHPST